MSRLGKQPVAIPSGVEVKALQKDNDRKRSKSYTSRPVKSDVEIKIEDEVNTDSR